MSFQRRFGAPAGVQGRVASCKDAARPLQGRVRPVRVLRDPYRVLRDQRFYSPAAPKTNPAK